MTDSATPIDSAFLEQKHKHFDLLCRNLGLEAGLQENGDGYAIASAAAGNVRVFFEHERGLCGLQWAQSTMLSPCVARKNWL